MSGIICNSATRTDWGADCAKPGTIQVREGVDFSCSRLCKFRSHLSGLDSLSDALTPTNGLVYIWWDPLRTRWPMGREVKNVFYLSGLLWSLSSPSHAAQAEKVVLDWWGIGFGCLKDRLGSNFVSGTPKYNIMLLKPLSSFLFWPVVQSRCCIWIGQDEARKRNNSIQV